MSNMEKSVRDDIIGKLPEVTIFFWIMKICATTLGETAGDLLSMTLNVGYGVSSLILISIFIVSLLLQLFSKKYHPTLFWTVILSTSTAGTTISDYMDRTLNLGYVAGSMVLIAALIAALFIWKKTEGSLDIKNIKSFRAEIFYWAAILISNTLGTALGDFLADSSGLGFMGGAFLISGIIAAITLVYYYTNISRVFLFWAAFVLTRPLGATMGDLMTKNHETGGLDFGTTGSSAVLFTILLALVIYTSKQEKSKLSLRLD